MCYIFFDLNIRYFVIGLTCFDSQKVGVIITLQYATDFIFPWYEIFALYTILGKCTMRFLNASSFNVIYCALINKKSGRNLKTAEFAER